MEKPIIHALELVASLALGDDLAVSGAQAQEDGVGSGLRAVGRAHTASVAPR